MVDSRAKGARGEYLVRDMLREATGLKFERVPASGALEYLKGDLYVPNQRNHYCIEVKNYKDSPLNDKIFTAKKTNNLIRGGKDCNTGRRRRSKAYAYFLNTYRSKVFSSYTRNTRDHRRLYVDCVLDCYILLAEDFLKEDVEWIGGF